MNLQLSLKTKWFEMTKAGIKTEDYRDLTLYWASRLLERIPVPYGGYLSPLADFKKGDYKFKGWKGFAGSPFRDFKTNTMTLGYPKSTDNKRIIQFEHAGIEITTGNPEWGAEPNKLYFVIKHGKRI